MYYVILYCKTLEIEMIYRMNRLIACPRNMKIAKEQSREMTNKQACEETNGRGGSKNSVII